MDHCYQMWKLANDGNSLKDYYYLQHRATARANSPWVLNSAAIGNYPANGTSLQTWVDWDPDGASYGNCRTIGLGITVAGYGASGSFTGCETIDMVKSNPEVRYTEIWYQHGVRESRGLKYLVAVKVNQGGWPIFALPAEVHGSLI